MKNIFSILTDNSDNMLLTLLQITKMVHTPTGSVSKVSKKKFRAALEGLEDAASGGNGRGNCQVKNATLLSRLRATEELRQCVPQSVFYCYIGK